MLTPKEKAKTLINNFYNLRGFDWDMALNCSLIAVDEILKSGCTLPSDNAYYGDNEEAIKYWLEVKQEIENL